MKRKQESSSDQEPDIKKRKTSNTSRTFNSLIRNSGMRNVKNPSFIILREQNQTVYLIYNDLNNKMVKFFGHCDETACSIFREKCTLNEEEHKALKILTENDKLDVFIDYDDYSLIYEHLNKKYDFEKIDQAKIESEDIDLTKYTFEEMFGYEHGIYD